MKLPGLTPGVSFVPKSQLRLILPATNRQEENSVFLWQDLHSSPRLHTGYSVRYKKKTPAFAGVYKTQFFRIYLASAASSAFASGLASAIFSSTVVKGLICTLIAAVTVGFK